MAQRNPVVRCGPVDAPPSRMVVTRDHIRFYDAVRLREAHAALAADTSRVLLAHAFVQSLPHHRRGLDAVPPIATPVSVHRLIPPDPRHAAPRDAHLLGNLYRFVQTRKRLYHESTEAALLHYAVGTGNAGQRDYAKHAKRWLRRLRR